MLSTKESVTKVAVFFLLCLCVLGIIGGIGYAIYGGSWPIAIGVCVIGIAAIPTIKKLWKKLLA